MRGRVTAWSLLGAHRSGVPLGVRVLLAAVSVLGLAPGPARPSRHPYPPIVFVSRNSIPGDPEAIPGLGPRDRAAARGGRLLKRGTDGRVRGLLPEGALFDVSDPAVSFDGRRVAFAGTPHPDSGWRIYLTGVEGGAPVPVTRTDRSRDLSPLGRWAERFERYDDLDPCWIGDSALCFASTRDPELAQYADVPVTNLYVVGADGRGLGRITSERNGAEEPVFDPKTGHLVYTRWWFNRYRAARDAAAGITTDPAQALPGDSVNLWQAVEIGPKARTFRLAAGAIRSRVGTMAYQPAFLADGTIAAVYAANLGLFPRPGGTGIQAFPGRYGRARRLAGAIVSERGNDPYSSTRGLASPSACSPAGLPDGRIVFAYDPGARGDFGLYSMNSDGSGIERLIDLPGTLELDPTPVVARRDAARAVRPAPGVPSSGSVDLLGIPFALESPAAGGPLTHEPERTFVYECRSLFAQGPVDSPVPEGPLIARGLSLRFFAVIPRSESAGHDTAILIRETPLAGDGSIRAEGLPAEVPMFEQLVDAHRHAVMTAHGPAHVAGMNWGASGTTVQCVGCHLGHSTLPAGEELRAGDSIWVNASPSARVTASSVAPGTAGPRAAVDRRTLGPTGEVAWVANGDAEESLRLSWAAPLRVREVVLYGPRAVPSQGTDLRIERCELRLFRDGAEVARLAGLGPVSPAGTRIGVDARVLDAIEIRIERVRGRAAQHRAAALAEVETLARPAEPVAGRPTPE